MDRERPRGREKNVTGGGNGVHKRGEGLGTGPVGSPNGYGNNNRRENSDNFGGNNYGGSNPFMSRATKAGGGGLGLVAVVVILLKVFGGGSLGDVAGALLGGGSADNETVTSTYEPSSYESSPIATNNTPASQTSYSTVDTSVATGSRNKYTNIAGGGTDDVTIMVYMCGTDLESQNGMASSDLSEMAAAKFGSKINIIVYTGGCSRWRINGISNTTNQIYQVADGKIKQLVANDGNKAMTDPNTLAAFIKWCSSNFPANRNELIFWDHGGGSVSGYGYDEKFPRSGSMSIANIDKALKAGGVKFDFVGFDACLMATAETALMMNNHADYMIASEETEPGIGWYYTNWLTKFGENTSMPTVEIGKNIVDDFVSKCATQCRGQQTTLSVIDLAEFAYTVPSKLTSFSKSLSSLITNNNYKTVSDARYQTREFARSTKIDQIDLVDLCNKVGNNEGKALSEVLKNAIKYNKTSTNMTNAYGISIYFPYQRSSNVDKACDIYDDIGLDDSYADCIKQFASLEVGGQVAAGGSASPVGSLFDLLGGMTGTPSGSGSSDAIGQLLNSFMGSGGASTLINGLGSGNMGFFSGKSISTKNAANYIAKNNFDASALKWKKSGEKYLITLPESQWKLVHALDLNMFYDDGEGYIDLGLDNVYDWAEDGSLIAETDRTWLAINGQPVAYYHVDTTEYGDQYTITGRVPAMLNGKRVNIWLVFDNEHPHGYISGAQSDYQEVATTTVAKNMTELKKGDKIDFLCDYYTYNGEYKDSYYLGEQMTYNGKVQISNVDVGSGKVRIMYRFTDIYNQEYWSENIKL